MTGDESLIETGKKKNIFLEYKLISEIKNKKPEFGAWVEMNRPNDIEFDELVDWIQTKHEIYCTKDARSEQTLKNDDEDWNAEEDEEDLNTGRNDANWKEDKSMDGENEDQESYSSGSDAADYQSIHDSQSDSETSSESIIEEDW